jgi:hypothetical protein
MVRCAEFNSLTLHRGIGSLYSQQRSRRGCHERVHRDFIGRPPLRCCLGLLHAFCSGTNYLDHHVRVGEHDDMAACDLRHFGAHALGVDS